MAAGISVKLPLVLDPSNGYLMNTSIEETTSQNLKMLILTAPGERVMDSKFGVGLRNFIFAQNTPQTKAQISSTIQSQIAKYMNFLQILKIDIKDFSDNAISIFVEYRIKPLNVIDILAVDVSL